MSENQPSKLLIVPVLEFLTAEMESALEEEHEKRLKAGIKHIAGNRHQRFYFQLDIWRWKTNLVIVYFCL